ncbi:divergent polysaccharide deacetylase family protein [Sinimarinibacterium sp. CAU 1509]|uniref:divergent polysaccharide deacetylase family protein n=1 Tax=Sinimarinibacterium sp. CAU 1509 TaxID=2562283 RepID=UPI0010AB60D4|nr:divergent polysaccharide deacetylase family protein [Sinimarinibacterium sp. CAU 1509]TJY64813.1 divergent polysaccharide deacetylase family protein [Sinimarinibacterium sp. CAU 1509]
MRSRPGACAATALLLIAALGAVRAVAAAPLVSVIIDDMGDSLQQGRTALELPGAVAYAFLPESPHTVPLAERAYAAHKEILVHLPLQPMEARAHPLALSMQASAPSRHDSLQQLLASVPHATGVNNHQGSQATANLGQMRWLMRELSLHPVGFFVDSRTTPNSVAYAVARAYGIPSTRRQVFLDHDPDADAVEQQFSRLIALAQRDGSALAIGHPHPATLSMLARRLPQLAQQGISLIAPSELIRRVERSVPTLPVALRMSPALGHTSHSGTAAAIGAPPADRPAASPLGARSASPATALAGPALR